MKTRMWVALGAVLPAVLGPTLGSMTSGAIEGSLSDPVAPRPYAILLVGIGISHLLVGLGLWEVWRRSTGRAAIFAAVATVATFVDVGCELWAASLAKSDLHAGVVDALNVAYVVVGIGIVVGSAGAALHLRDTMPRLTGPLALSAALLAVAVVVKYAVSVTAGIGILTVWSLSYLWLAFALRERRKEPERGTTSAGGAPDPAD